MDSQDKIIRIVSEIAENLQEEVDDWDGLCDGELEDGTTVACEWIVNLLEKSKDALDLLRKHKSRLMTVEEVVGYIALRCNKTLWFEFRDGNIKEMNTADVAYRDILYDDGEDYLPLNEPNLMWEDEGKRDGVIIAEYNDTFRCWSSHPTSEQRKVIEWNR